MMLKGQSRGQGISLMPITTFKELNNRLKVIDSYDKWEIRSRDISDTGKAGDPVPQLFRPAGQEGVSPHWHTPPTVPTGNSGRGGEESPC